MKKFFGLLLAAVMTFSLVACGAQNVPSDNTSDDYPSGPITCIVPYAAGGGSDVLTRTIMKYISLPNNVNMVAVNVEGASGYTGCLQAAKSDPDGYTILAHNPMDVVGFTLSGSTTEELYKEMELICCVVNDYGVVMTNTTTGWTSLDEMAAYAKEHPGEVKLGTTGVNTVNYADTLRLMKALGIENDIMITRAGQIANNTNRSVLYKSTQRRLEVMQLPTAFLHFVIFRMFEFSL